MPDAFFDYGSLDVDCGITFASDWTVTAGLPNGDNYAVATGTITDPNFAHVGAALDLRDGTAWTVECWMYMPTASLSLTQVIASSCYPGSATLPAWRVALGTDDKLSLTIYNTSATTYLGKTTTSALTAATWYPAVWIKETGNALKLYLNNAVDGSTSTSTAGTALTPTAPYRLYLGSMGDDSLGLVSSAALQVSKFAVYNAELSAARIGVHYLAMTT